MILMILGGLLSFAAFVAFVWLAVLAFKQHIGWGAAVLLLPFAYIVFAIRHWPDAKRPFIANVACTVLGAALMVVGVGTMAAGAASAMQAEMMNDPEFAKAMQEMKEIAQDVPSATAGVGGAVQLERPAAGEADSYDGSMNDAQVEAAPVAQPDGAEVPPQAPKVQVVEQALNDGSNSEWLAQPVETEISVRSARKYVGERMRITGSDGTPYCRDAA